MIGHGGRDVLDIDGIDAAFSAAATCSCCATPATRSAGSTPPANWLAVGEVVEANGGRVFADEIHAPLIYPGHAHIPYASVSEVTAAHAVTAISASKGWNLPGLKCAQLHAEATRRSRELWAERGFTFEHGASTPGACGQHRRVLRGQAWLDDVVLAYLDRSRCCSGTCSPSISRVGFLPPEGTYLAWLDCRGLGLGDNPSEFFLDKGSVLVNDGPAFGEAGKGHVRLNFATPWPILQEIVGQMGQAVANS